jgi:hypothetical protein
MSFIPNYQLTRHDFEIIRSALFRKGSDNREPKKPLHDYTARFSGFPHGMLFAGKDVFFKAVLFFY